MGADYPEREALQAVWEGGRKFRGAKALPPVLVMTDPRRPGLRLGLWPGPVGLVYRHFGAEDRIGTAHELRQRTFAGGHTLLIGDDPELAVEVGADGVHFRRDTMHDISLWRARAPGWVLTQAAPRDDRPVSPALDAVLVSSVFPSRSPSAGTPIGVRGLEERAAALALPTYALGGVSARNIHCLPPSIAGVAGVSFTGKHMTDDLTIEKHINGSDIRFTATHPDHPGLEAELDLKGAGQNGDGMREYAATHTGVPGPMEGKGVGSALYRAMVADAREQDYRILAVCPFIVAKAKRDKTARDVFVTKS